jgi:hypothetical protein
MPNSKIKKCVNQSIDELLFKCGIEKDLKLFGQPLEDFDINDLSLSERSKFRKLLINKLEAYEI